MSQSTVFPALGLVGAILLVGCTNASPEPAPPGEGATYNSGIAKLIEDKCASCHQAGGIAPFSLTTYDEITSELDAVKSAIERKSMPPWPAASDCNEYANDRSLSDDEADEIVGWIDRGAPLGAASEQAEESAESGLSRVDLTLAMPVAYTPKLVPDDYRCFLIDWPEDTTKFVTGFRANPGNAATVHHVIAYLVPPSAVDKYDALDAEDDEPGYTCFGGPGGGIDMDTRFAGSWAPGSTGGDLPQGTGIKVEPGSKIALQIHYNTLSEITPDLSSVDFRLDDEVEYEGVWQFFTDLQWVLGSGMEIPAATSDVKHEYAMDPTGFVSGGAPFKIHSVGLHMHTAGQSAKLSVERAASEGPSTAEECLLSIPDWNFHWQLSYELSEPYLFSPGDRLHIACEWDNPSMKPLSWGEGTGDEMCLGLIYYTVPK